MVLKYKFPHNERGISCIVFVLFVENSKRIITLDLIYIFNEFIGFFLRLFIINPRAPPYRRSNYKFTGRRAELCPLYINRAVEFFLFSFSGILRDVLARDSVILCCDTLYGQVVSWRFDTFKCYKETPPKQ